MFLAASPSKAMQNHLDMPLKKQVLDPKHAKLDQKSEHGHVQHVPKAPSEGETLQYLSFGNAL